MHPRADIILANRAFVDHDEPPGTKTDFTGGSGGLLAAVRPIIVPWENDDGTTWIGAGRGAFDRHFTDSAGLELLHTDRGPLRHQRLYFDDLTWEAHYSKVANSFLWPLLHLVREPLPEVTPYYPRPVAPSDDEWEAYRRVNDAFAASAMCQPQRASCWVQDYQLALAPEALRARDFPGKIGFFLHTPFPDLNVAEAFLDAKARGRFREFVEGILGADLAGFQSRADLERFTAAAEQLCGAERTAGGVRVLGHSVTLAAYPVGIDCEGVEEVAQTAALPELVTNEIDPSLPLVVGLERADFTKGIPERLEALARAYERGVRFNYVGVAAPTREGVAIYADLNEAIERTSARAAKAAAAAGARFLYSHESLPWESVVALQREADVVFTSSLADGMNLVPLQTVVAQAALPVPERGLVLSGRDAGVSVAYSEFANDGLVPVDPFDAEAMCQTLTEAVEGRLPKISDRLVAEVRANSALHWATNFLEDLEKAEC